MSEPALGAAEEDLWRALLRVIGQLPRALDEDLSRGSALSLSEYAVLANLSEGAPDGVRMSALAAGSALSASRTTRVVEGLRGRGLVVKRRDSGDGRGNLAQITDAGLAAIRAAYPVHLASARRHVLDLVGPSSVAEVGHALARIADSFGPAPAQEPGRADP